VFAGCDEQLTYAPVEYPTASSSQAWAAGAPLLLLTTTLGLVPVGDGLCCDAQLPAEFGKVALSGLPGRWGRADITTEAVAPATAG
jgi:glycogen debranching enzyme